MLGDLGVSTLRSIKIMTRFSSLFGASNQPCCLLQCSGLLYECIFDALLFSSSYRPDWETCFLITLLLDLLSPPFLFMIIIPAILPATMLGYYSMSVSSMPSDFFLVVFIYWKSASYRSSLDLTLFGKTTNRSDATQICFFFLDRRACYSTCR
jgi:hypothetical protein